MWYTRSFGRQRYIYTWIYFDIIAKKKTKKNNDNHRNPSSNRHHMLYAVYDSRYLHKSIDREKSRVCTESICLHRFPFFNALFPNNKWSHVGLTSHKANKTNVISVSLSTGSGEKVTPRRIYISFSCLNAANFTLSVQIPRFILLFVAVFVFPTRTFTICKARFKWRGCGLFTSNSTFAGCLCVP